MNRGEISPERRTVVGRQTDRADRTRSGAGLLARLELRQTWPSYLTGVLVALLVGLFTLSLLWAGRGQSSGANGVINLSMDFFFVSMLTNLGINWTSSRWMFVHTDPFTTLPISVRALILGRLVLVLATAAIASLAFFAPSYALFSPLRADIPPAQFFWFALFWVGYVLFSAGGLLFLEMGVKGVSALVACLIWAMLLLAIVVFAQVAGGALVTGSLGLVETNGPLVAIPVLAAGGAGLSLWCRLLESD